MLQNNQIPRSEEQIPVTLREYVHPRLLHSSKKPTPAKEGPLNVVILTSVRDVGREDRNGRMVLVKGRPRYMMGMVEALTIATKEKLWGLDKLIKLTGVIYDDTEDDVIKNKLGPYSLYTPTDLRGQWIHPIDQRNAEDIPLLSLTKNVPSDFRALPKNAKDERNAKRREWEDEVFRVSQELGADFVLSDHLMVKIRHLFEEIRYGVGKVLNIHPAIMDPKDPGRLPGSTPTMDALSRATGASVLDKKTGLYLPFIRDRKTGKEVKIPRNERYFTGASLHIIDDVYLDNGPVIADSKSTQVIPYDEDLIIRDLGYQATAEQELRYFNYRVKLAVLACGLEHYVKNIFPELGEIDLHRERRKARRVVQFQ